MQIKSPKDIQELVQRANQLQGLTLGEIARKFDSNIPNNLLHAKGWVGQLIERVLGASAQSYALPDFPELGIELKTLPVNDMYKPLETTYVCTIQTNSQTLKWEDCWVYHKLRHVLWIPIISSATIDKRVIGTPFLWQMDEPFATTLRTDWEELMEMLELGYGKKISAKYGTYLHIRPKAANGRVLVDYLDADGLATKITPQGFYLRTTFTKELLAQFFKNKVI